MQLNLGCQGSQLRYMHQAFSLDFEYTVSNINAIPLPSFTRRLSTVNFVPLIVKYSRILIVPEVSSNICCACGKIIDCLRFLFSECYFWEKFNREMQVI